MAKQSGIIKIEGTIGDITFLRTKDGYIAREKTSINGTRIAGDQAFQRTRENGAEFGRAGKASKVLNKALRNILLRTADGRMISRLVKQMVKVIKADETNPRGQRNVIDGEAVLLQGFEFNIRSPLSTTVHAPYTATINRVSGEMTINFAPFVPVNQISAPSGATHFRIVSAAADIDFENGTYTTSVQSTAELPWNGQPAAAINLVATVNANSTHPLFQVLGIDFFQQVNGVMYPLNAGAFNALAIIGVSGE